MSNVVALSSKIESVLMHGDLSKLSSEEKVSFYNKVCASLGLNPLTKPFDYIKLNGKEVLYAKRDCTDQLRRIYSVSITEVRKETAQDIIMVTATARDKSGREDTAMGAVSIKGLAGESLANALMKAETKAKRRVTLSICGLGFLDESEIEDASVDEAGQARARELTTQVQDTDDVPEFEQYIELEPEPITASVGDYVVKVGKKNKGKKLSAVPLKDMHVYLDWYATQKDPPADIVEVAEKMVQFLALKAPDEQ